MVADYAFCCCFCVIFHRRSYKSAVQRHINFYFFYVNVLINLLRFYLYFFFFVYGKFSADYFAHHEFVHYYCVRSID